MWVNMVGMSQGTDSRGRTATVATVAASPRQHMHIKAARQVHIPYYGATDIPATNTTHTSVSATFSHKCVRTTNPAHAIMCAVFQAQKTGGEAHMSYNRC